MLNVNDVLHNNVPILNFHSFEKFAIKSLMSKYVSNDWLTTVSIKPKLEFYQQYKTTFEPANYCKIMLTRKQRSLIAKIRLVVFPINLELGRYNSIPRNERYCQV